MLRLLQEILINQISVLWTFQQLTLLRTHRTHEGGARYLKRTAVSFQSHPDIESFLSIREPRFPKLALRKTSETSETCRSAKVYLLPH
jgi:hypothetical protein